MCSRSLRRSVTAIMPRVCRPRVFTGPRAHRHLKSSLKCLFHAMAGRLERSDIVLKFLTIMRSAPILPLLLRPAQDLLVRAGVDLTPNCVRRILGLYGHRLHPWVDEVMWEGGVCGRSQRLGPDD